MFSKFSKKLVKLNSVALLAGCALFSQAAHSAFPEKTITIVVPFSPGGSTDQVGRQIAQHFTEDLGVTAVVENRPGAAGAIGNGYVARSKPDGYTLLIGGSEIVAGEFIYDLPYSPGDDFVPIGLVLEFPFLLLTNKPGIETFDQFLEYAKENPEKLNIASAGVGNSTHLAGETFMHAAGLTSMTHVPYNGSTEALTAVISEQVDVMFDTAITSAPLVTGGKATALGVLAERRITPLPEIPTMAELGFTEFGQLAPWSFKGLFAPTGTPDETLEILHTSLTKLLEDEEFQQSVEKNASLVFAPRPISESIQLLHDLRQSYGKLIAGLGIEKQ